MLEKYAPRVYEALNGIFCVYKPRGMPAERLKVTIQHKLQQELNSLPCRPSRQIVEIHEDRLGTNLPLVTTLPDVADDPLVVGPRYLHEDFYVDCVSSLKRDASGVTVYGIGHVGALLRKILHANFIRVYTLKGQFGTATQDFTPEGHLIAKTTYKHITQAKVDRVTAAIQAGHQRQMFYYAGVDLQSQEAYDLACQGLIRPVYSPTKKIPPLIYGIKCTQFDPPDFELEVKMINEQDAYLKKLIHEIGLQLHSSAVCTQVRRVQYGTFTLDHALLSKHWTAENIISNIKLCRGLVAPEQLKPPGIITSSERKLDRLTPGGDDGKTFLEGL